MWIFGKIAGLFSSYLRILTIAGFVAMGTVVGVLWWQKAAAEKRVAALTIDNDRLIGQVGALKLTLADREEAIRALEETNKQLSQHALQLNTLLQEIHHAPASDDGPIAPVLDRLLKRIDGLRN